MLTSLISWGLSLIFSGLYVRELSQRVKGLDYHAASLPRPRRGLGDGPVVIRSNADGDQVAISPSLFGISGVIPLTDTLFLWQSIALTAVLIAVSVLVAWVLGSVGGERGLPRTTASIPVNRGDDGTAYQAGRVARVQSAAQYSRRHFCAGISSTCFVPSPLAALDLNTYNLIFITVGILLALATEALHESGCGVRARDRWRADPVSVLCRDLRNDRRHRHLRLAGRSVRSPDYAQHLSTAGCDLLGGAWGLHSVRAAANG